MIPNVKATLSVSYEVDRIPWAFIRKTTFSSGACVYVINKGAFIRKTPPSSGACVDIVTKMSFKYCPIGFSGSPKSLEELTEDTNFTPVYVGGVITLTGEE